MRPPLAFEKKGKTIMGMLLRRRYQRGTGTFQTLAAEPATAPVVNTGRTITEPETVPPEEAAAEDSAGGKKKKK